MNRAVYLAGWGWVAIAVVALMRGPAAPPRYSPFPIDRAVHPTALPPGPSDGYAWFERNKPYCNTLEVETRLRHDPAPSTTEGAGYAAACLALAGRMVEAKAFIDALSPSEREAAAGIVFGVGHPVADMGDDASAGPMMRLVVEYQPWNYMAMYHAGISYYELGEAELARDHLVRFLEMYSAHDGWRSNAEHVLKSLRRDGVR